MKIENVRWAKINFKGRVAFLGTEGRYSKKDMLNDKKKERGRKCISAGLLFKRNI